MSDNYEFAESLGAHHPGEVSLTVAQAEERERSGVPLPISGDAETDHAKELLAIRRARQEDEAQTAVAPVKETETTGCVPLIGPGESCAGAQLDTPFLINHCLELVEMLKHELDRFGTVVLEDHPGTMGKPDGEVELSAIVSGNRSANVQPFPCMEPGKGNVFYLSEESIRQLELLCGASQPINDSAHEASPSVGAPNSALRDNSNPTEGDPTHKPAVRCIAQAAAAVDREKELAAKRGAQYDRYQDNVRPGDDIRLTVGEAMDNERDGYPTPVSGDPVVTLQEAIERGAVTVTKGLPAAVVWSRANPGLAGTHSPIHWTSHGLQMSIGLWPSPSHQALTDSMKALAGVQRRLMFSGRLAVAQ